MHPPHLDDEGFGRRGLIDAGVEGAEWCCILQASTIALPAIARPASAPVLRTSDLHIMLGPNLILPLLPSRGKTSFVR
jgi:hypothetical protein